MPSPFATAELNVTPSPASPSELNLPAGASVVDFDIWPTGADAVILTHDKAGNHVVSWHAGDTSAVPLLDLPATFNAASIAVHPGGQNFFIEGKTGPQSQILVANKVNGSWTQHTIYQTAADVRRLLVAPRPFEIGFNDTTNQAIESYRLFFAERQPSGAYSTRSITEDGQREYQVIGPQATYVKIPDEDEDPTPNFVSSALPESFHPDGHLLIWEDGNGCFQQLAYAGQNWDKPSHVAGNPCGGSLTVTPNGAALLHWKSGVPGVAVISDHGRTISMQAGGYQFVSTPSSVPDGKGIVGLVEKAGAQALVYVPIEVPLADVINAWMFTQDAADRNSYTTSGGLLRTTDEDQMYELYDTESYACGRFDSATPTRPYLVTTDIFWELVASAYEGAFIVQERQQAMPAFWAFVDAARQSLNASAPGSTWAVAFNAVAGSESATNAANSSNASSAEALHIQQAQGTFDSPVFGKAFDFTELTPRGYYTATPEMQEYFKAVHYLTTAAATIDATPLNSLPDDVKVKALQWIAAYTTYIAPGRAPLVWSAGAFVPPAFALHPVTSPQIFPLSWGFDNEVLLSTVFHSDWPAAEQIIGPKGPRGLPSGLDLAAALGSSYARSLLKTDLAAYPALHPVLDALQKRQPQSATQPDLYDAWINALAVQWADDAIFPGNPPSALWNAKRIQTGLASWATLRHATVLVNERSTAECGEGGFEAIVLRPPRGYVEPDPKTFEAIASLFDQMQQVVAKSANFTGDLPQDDPTGDKAAQPLRDGIIRRLQATASKARLFEAMAEKELQNQPLSDTDYDEILHVGAVAEHDFLVYNSLASADLALSTPNPIMKIADVAGGGQVPYLEAAVGRPLEWDQVVPYFGRREIVKGSVYSYYEFSSPTPLTDLVWAGKPANPDADPVNPAPADKAVPGKVEVQAHPAWISSFISRESLSCPAAPPF
ncbi:MAG TPA: DUF3160 domain-containing protein [Terracidiphilus sp.]|nr:DUF3160 domain-containing protein [Terracidiphilus sp.]